MARTSLRTLWFFTQLGCAKSVREALREERVLLLQTLLQPA